jgi:hypothetical protein
MPANGQTWSGRGGVSYSANWYVFHGGWGEDWSLGPVNSYPRNVPDGTSNTIFFAEKYTICGDPAQNGQNQSKYVEHIWGEDGQSAGACAYVNNGFGSGGSGCLFHSSFFALPPAGTGNTPANIDAIANYPWSFMLPPQSQPPIKPTAAGGVCDPARLQAFYAGGMMVGMGDGSVRLVSSGVSQATFGRAVDPADGQPLGSDW